MTLSHVSSCSYSVFSFFFNDPATTEIYTLSLHDALPICAFDSVGCVGIRVLFYRSQDGNCIVDRDRKSTRLNSSHPSISYAVFCLKKKKKNTRFVICTAPSS